jgi:short-subunit dehydrogenase
LPSGPDYRALVTGASSGIGSVFAHALRARGAKLVLVARRAQRLSELSSALGGSQDVAVVPLDLSSPDAVPSLMTFLQDHGITVDLLVNNAGVGWTGPFVEQSVESVQQILDLNVRALVGLTRALVPGMIERGRGGVVNVVSTSAFQPVPFLNVYAASKAFVLSFTEGLATELKGTGVRVQALCPGLTESEFHETSGTAKVPFTKTRMMPARAVVEQSLRALDRGRPLRVIPGWHNRAVAGSQRFLPRGLVRAVSAQLFRPPRKGR